VRKSATIHRLGPARLNGIDATMVIDDASLERLAAEIDAAGSLSKYEVQFESSGVVRWSVGDDKFEAKRVTMGYCFETVRRVER
jgi:hypothetical protein